MMQFTIYEQKIILAFVVSIILYLFCERITFSITRNSTTKTILTGQLLLGVQVGHGLRQMVPLKHIQIVMLECVHMHQPRSN